VFRDSPHSIHNYPIVVHPLFNAIEDGVAFSASQRVSISNGSTVGFYFENPSGSGKKVYIVAIIARGKAEGDIDIYEGATVTTPGTAITPRNLNLGSTNTSVCNIEYGGAYDISGANLVKPDVLPGGSGVRAVGDLAEVGDTIIMPPGTSLLVNVTNTSQSASDYAVSFKWIEVTE